MRIYAVADIHGRPERLERVKRKAVETEADVMIVAGDLAGYFSQKRSAVQLADMPLPVLAVRGNSDRAGTEKTLWPKSGITSLHLNKSVINGLVFSGISGTFLLPFASRLCFAEEAFVDRYQLFFRDVSVLVVHPPPRGAMDKVLGRFQAGSAALRRLVAIQPPPVLICGHIHENPGATRLGDTRLGDTMVINCSIGRSGSGALIDWREPGGPSVEMLS